MQDAADDLVPAPEWAAAGVSWSTCRACKVAVMSVAYIAFYLTLDRLSFIGALHGIGITPWSPSSGLAMALLIVKGLRCAPLVLAAEVLSSATLPPAAVSALPVCLESLWVTACYSGAASILRHAGVQAGIRRSSDAITLLIVTVVNSGLVAGGFVAAYAAAGIVPWSGFVEAAFYFWVGDAIGVVVVTPPLLFANELINRRTIGDRHWAALKLAEFATQGMSVVAALAAVGARPEPSARPFPFAISILSSCDPRRAADGKRSGACFRGRSQERSLAAKPPPCRRARSRAWRGTTRVRPFARASPPVGRTRSRSVGDAGSRARTRSCCAADWLCARLADDRRRQRSPVLPRTSGPLRRTRG